MIGLSIRRPVAVAMTYMAVALLGVFAWQNIPIERLPDTDLPRLTMSASWPGSSPETVEAFLTSPLESMVQQVQGVEKVTSVSSEGSASITVEFDIDTDMDFARLDLSERLSQVRDELPDAAQNISVSPYVPREFADQTRPFLLYTFTGPYTLEGLQLHLEDVVVPELQRLEGVGAVETGGARERVLRVRVDEEATRAIGLSPFAIEGRIRELDLVREVGAVREAGEERTITIVNRPQSAVDIRNAIIARVGDRTVRVSDVATVEDAFQDPTRLERIDGRPAVFLQLRKEIGANTVRVTDVVKARMAELERLNPYGSEFILEYEESETIREELADLRTRALAAGVVIFFVLLLFLGSLRSAALIFATIAFSVLISLNLIYFGGLTLNLLTLTGLALGFGLIVDNSIVVLENIYRRWQSGEAAGTAAAGGAREVVLPIFASTATTLIVFVPFVYLQGELRIYYVPLAIVVALTLTASIFVAFTLIPALSARWLAVGKARRAPPVSGRLATASEAGAPPAAERGGGEKRPLYVLFYESIVGFNLRHPVIAIVVTLACFAGSWYVFDQNVPRRTIWGGGSGGGESYVSISINLQRGESLDRTDQLVRFFEEKLAEISEVESYRSRVGTTQANLEVQFPDSLEFTAVPNAIKDQMFAYSLTFTGAEVRVRGVGPAFTRSEFYGGGGSPPTYRIQVLGYNYERVREIAENLGRRLLAIPRVVDVDTNASGNFSRERAIEYVVRVDRDRLAQQDMTVQEFQQQVAAAIRTEGRATPIKLGGEEVDYQVKVRDVEDQDVLALRQSMLRTSAGELVRLADVATIEPRDVLANIRRENQQYERTVAYEFRGPRRLGDVMRDLIIEATELPPGYSIEETTPRFFGQDQRNQINLVLAIAILLVYMVTSALFESLRQPLAVLLTVPMALIGVFLIFVFAEASFTREAYVAVIMMGGIVVNNAILLVDHVNRVRAEGVLSLYDAVLRGTLERVRPILMTTATTVFGLLPLVLFSETADASIWNALAYVLIGGLLSSTLFVLTVTPVLYWLFESTAAERADLRRRTEGGGRGIDGPPGGRDSIDTSSPVPGMP
ncbi:MAG TPA: efflux RND transporter permease subunit [Longimicrobiales bacterium]|nr:efflux RND transporter permease subunit [Longimicrobiales bacterium]